jgi:hypothetical protein
MLDTVNYIYDWESYQQSLENPNIEPKHIYTEKKVKGDWVLENV